MAETRNYPILVAGVSNYQPAIARCREWDRVWLFHESDNPHDQLAIVVKTERGETIGYLPKNNWISDAVHREGVGATALILALKKWSGPTLAAKGGGEVAMEELHLVHEGIEYT